MLEFSTILPVALVSGAVAAFGGAAWVRKRVAKSKVVRSGMSSGKKQRIQQGAGAARESRELAVEQLQPVATRLLKSPEHAAWRLLTQVLPEYAVFAQVPLARFVRVVPNSRSSYNDWLQHMGSLCADLVVCDQTSQVVAVVEIREPLMPEQARLKARQGRLDRALAAANIPVHVWLAGSLPGSKLAREMILGSIPQQPAGREASFAPAASGSSVAGIAGLQVAEASFDEFDQESSSLPDSLSSQEGDRLTPPPSIWFDDTAVSAS